MNFTTSVPDPSIFSLQLPQKSMVINHLVRRNLISQMEDLIKDSNSHRNTDLLLQIQNHSKQQFQQTLISQIIEKENTQKKNRENKLRQIHEEENKNNKIAEKKSENYKHRKLDSLILNGNKILNENRKIEDVLDEMKKTQNVSMADLNLTEEFISKPILFKHDAKIDRFPVVPLLEKPIFHNDSKGFSSFPESKAYRESSHRIGGQKLQENRLILPRNLAAVTPRVIDCSDIYAMMQEQSLKNRLMFERKLT